MQDSFQTIVQQLILHIHELENPESKSNGITMNRDEVFLILSAPRIGHWMPR